MSKSFVACCKKASHIIERLSTWGAGALFLVNLVDILGNVFSRYLFNISPIWTEELARFALIWSVMIGANCALYYGEHVSITFIDRILPEPLLLILRWIRHLLIVFISGFMVYYGVIYVSNSWRFRTMGLQIPKAIPLMSIPIGTALFLIQYIFIQIATSEKEGVKK